MLLELGDEHLGDALIGAFLEVFVVEPFGFLDVEFGTAFADMFDAEEPDEFVHGH